MRPAPRLTVAALAAAVTVGLLAGSLTIGSVAPAQAEECNDSLCTPGITPGVVLGAPCANTATYVFGTTSWGRLVFCGSPRRYEPRYFRSPPMVGVKGLGANCRGFENYVAQAPDGLFLSCGFVNQQPVWVRGDE